MLRPTLCLIVSITFYSGALAQKLPAEPTNIDPKLPNVLLIGDSISIGYTKLVRKKLSGIANVFRPNTNCGPTTKGVAEIEKWLGDRKWNVIHFNHGLHDLKYMGPNNENLAETENHGRAACLMTKMMMRLETIRWLELGLAVIFLSRQCESNN